MGAGQVTDIGMVTKSSASRIYSSSNVISFRSGQPLGQPTADWRPAVVERLQELIRLPLGWDGYDGIPVSFANAFFAFQVLESTCRSGTPPPSIVPGSGGDLQIEWHLGRGEIELYVRAPNDVHAWRRSAGESSVEEELPLSTDFSQAARWLQELTEAPFVAHAAAA